MKIVGSLANHVYPAISLPPCSPPSRLHGCNRHRWLPLSLFHTINIILVVHSFVSLSGYWSFFPFLRDVPSPSPCNGSFFSSCASSSFSITRSFLLSVTSCRRLFLLIVTDQWCLPYFSRPVVPSALSSIWSLFRPIVYRSFLHSLIV